MPTPFSRRFAIPAIAAALAVSAAVPVLAQQPAPPRPTVVLPMQVPPPTAWPTFASSAELQAMIARARDMVQPGQPLLVQPIHRLGATAINLEYRRGPWPSAIHDDIELFFVVQGSGRYIQGGTQTGTGPAAAISGGQERRVAAGDFFFVPPGTPHQFPEVEGELVLISLHMPAN